MSVSFYFQAFRISLSNSRNSHVAMSKVEFKKCQMSFPSHFPHVTKFFVIVACRFQEMCHVAVSNVGIEGHSLSLNRL